jgi:hypothetical protein
MPPLKELLSKPMSRQEFLRLFAVAMLSLFGIRNILGYLTKEGEEAPRQVTAPAAPGSHGFGSRSFGA